MVKKKVVRCKFCKAVVDLDKHKYVLLGTYDGKKVLDEGYFHFDCWIVFFRTKVNEKANVRLDNIKNMAMKGMGLLKNLGINFMGSAGPKPTGMDKRTEVTSENFPNLLDAFLSSKPKEDGKKRKPKTKPKKKKKL